MTFPLTLSLLPVLWSQAKVDNEIIDYRDLAAIPRVKAIYDIEHPDMISYKSVNDNSSTLDNKGNRQDRQSPAEVTSPNAPSSLSGRCLSMLRLGLSHITQSCFLVLKSDCVGLTHLERGWFGAVVFLY